MKYPLVACRVLFLSATVLLFPSPGLAWTPPPGAELAVDAISPEALLRWRQAGHGTVADFRGQAVQMAEGEGSEGVVLISPAAYGEKVILRYRIFVANVSTVPVVILSASDGPATDALTLPPDYDGGIAPWIQEKPNYFFAFHNAAHLSTPFVRRIAGGGGPAEKLAEAGEGILRPGRWAEVETGRWDDRLWLAIDGRRILEARDERPHTGGHLVFRIRGTGIEKASCMIRDVRVATPAAATASAP